MNVLGERWLLPGVRRPCSGAVCEGTAAPCLLDASSPCEMSVISTLQVGKLKRESKDRRSQKPPLTSGFDFSGTEMEAPLLGAVVVGGCLQVQLLVPNTT